MSISVAIPARLESTRFPNKVLADLLGNPMLWHVYHGVASAKNIDDIWILSDSQEILDLAHTWGAKTLMTPSDCPSGTDRISWGADKIGNDIIINVQGDEPLITGDVIDKLGHALIESDADVATPLYKISSIEELTNQNVTKAVRDQQGYALYFSRSPIPFIRESPMTNWLNIATFWGHPGLYAYRKQILKEYPTLPAGNLEQLEKLEQLRLLENGKKIATIPISYRPHAVDTPEDLEEVKNILRSK